MCTQYWAKPIVVAVWSWWSNHLMNGLLGIIRISWSNGALTWFTLSKGSRVNARHNDIVSVLWILEAVTNRKWNLCFRYSPWENLFFCEPSSISHSKWMGILFEDMETKATAVLLTRRRVVMSKSIQRHWQCPGWSGYRLELGSSAWGWDVLLLSWYFVEEEYLKRVFVLSVRPRE